MTVRLNPDRGQAASHYVLCDGHGCSRVSQAPLRFPWRSLTLYARGDRAPELLHFHHGPCMADWVQRSVAA